MTPGLPVTWPDSVRCTNRLGRFRETPKKNLQKLQNTSCIRVARGYIEPMNETKTQTLLRNAEQALKSYREQENEARKALAMAVESTRKAKEKWEALFAKEQDEAVARLLSEYRHCTA